MSNDITPAANDNSNGSTEFIGSLAKLLKAQQDEETRKKNAKKWESLNLDADILREGEKIILPEGMETSDAIKALKRKLDDDNQITQVHEKIDAFPLEAAIAFVMAMQEGYGWASPVATPGFFGPQPPSFISVQTDVDEWVQVPWGSFQIPGVENRVQVGASRDNKNRWFFYIAGEVRKRERKILLDLATVTRRILREKSIYKGKAIHVATDDNGQLDLNNPPEFLDLKGTNPDNIILNTEVKRQIKVNIWGLLQNTDLARQQKIKLKRGVLMHGSYGTGKSLTARATGKIATDNAWTFIMVDRPESLKEALEFARRYQPAVVFCEDIDRGMSERTNKANDLLNTISGVVGNRDEIMVVLTTNHVDKINPAMLRPGRLDALIAMLPPNAPAVIELARMYAGRLLPHDTNLDKFGETMAGQIPASVEEAVTRSKLAAVSDGRKSINEEDLLAAAYDMTAHLELLAPKAKEPSPDESLGAAMRTVFAQELGTSVPNSDGTKKTNPNVPSVVATLDEAMKKIHEIHNAVA